MIRRISGTVVDVHPSHVVVDVHGIGYLVYTTAKMHAALQEPISLYTHLAVRENALDLYGFKSSEELSFFELLLTLPKIGPKSALQILSQADIALLQNAIISQDATHLSKMSGITKKTAEKIVLGLKDAFEGIVFASDIASLDRTDAQTSYASDVIDALVTLGYPQADARKTVQQLIAERPDITSANDAIRESLKLLS